MCKHEEVGGQTDSHPYAVIGAATFSCMYLSPPSSSLYISTKASVCLPIHPCTSIMHPSFMNPMHTSTRPCVGARKIVFTQNYQSGDKASEAFTHHFLTFLQIVPY